MVEAVQTFLPKLVKPLVLVSVLATATVARERQATGQKQPSAIQDPVQLVGKRINVQRLPLCKPGTYTADLAHAGKDAIVLSAKPAEAPAVPPSVLDRLTPYARDIILDQQKAALLLLQFEDGTKLDSCAAIGPRRLGDYIEVLPGQAPNSPAERENTAPTSVVIRNPTPKEELSDSEVNAALTGRGKDHWVDIEDMGLMAAQGSRAPSITLYMPDAMIAIQSESARKQYLKYEPSEEDRQRALTIVAEGYVAETVQGGCNSITRVVLLSNPSGDVVKEAYLSEPLGETWRNAFGAGNYCGTFRAKFWLDDVQAVRAAAKDGEFYVAAFSGAVNTKTYKVKRKHQSKLGLN